MKLLRRIKNLWLLSAYQTTEMDKQTSTILNQVGGGKKFITLKKDFPTIQKKQATIINLEDNKTPIEIYNS